MQNAPRIPWLRQTLREAAWGPLLVLFAVVAGIRAYDAFTRFPWIDVPAHFIGGIAATSFYRRAIVNAALLRGDSSKAREGLLAFACTAGTAVLWESFEFTSDRLLLTSLQHGMGDTLSDLAFGVAGALAYLTLRRLAAAPPASRGSVNGH